MHQNLVGTMVCPVDTDVKESACRYRYLGWCERIDKTLYRCECSPGWTDVHCDRWINHCENITCLNGALCRSTPFDYQCLCLTSSYSGRHCEQIETTLRVRQMLSKSFAYIVIIAFVLVFAFILALDILKYGFGIDPTKDEKENLRK